VVACLRKASNYLDGRRTAGGGWLIGSGFGAEVVEESQGIAVIGIGYLQLSHVTGDAGHRDRARGAFDWLVANQPANGAWGLPWAWGLQNGHFQGSVASHYPNGQDHPAGTSYAINSLMAGRALLTAYEEFRDERYLAAAKRVRDYILDPRTGFQWLDPKRTRGSVPYCTLDPIFAPDHPAIARHDVVSRLKNTSVDVYNIDAYAIRFLDHLRALTGEQRLTRYIRALLTNILLHCLPSGSIDYSWCTPIAYDFYTYTVAAAFNRYATIHSDQRVLEAGRRMMTVRSNLFPPGAIINEPEGVTPLGLDNTKSAVGYLKYVIGSQRQDGSWSGGTNTRNDGDKLSAATAILLQAGYTTGGRMAADRVRTPDLLLSEPGFASLAAFQKSATHFYP
jgi:hypothetical protein